MLQAQQFLRRDQVATKVGISKSSIFLLEKRGDFPKHFLVTPRCAVYRADEVDAWMAKRADAAITPAAAPQRGSGKANKRDTCMAKRDVVAITPAVAPQRRGGKSK